MSDKPLFDPVQLAEAAGKMTGEMIFNHRHCTVCNKPILVSEFRENKGRCNQHRDFPSFPEPPPMPPPFHEGGASSF